MQQVVARRARPWWVRALIGLPLFAIAAMFGTIVGTGIGVAGSDTGYDLIKVYSDDPGQDYVVIDEYYVPPWDVAQWLFAAAFLHVSLAVTLLALWAAWLVIRRPGSKQRRWSAAKRGFVWVFVALSAYSAVVAAFQHAENWHAWHELLASDPSIPDEPQAGQIPQGIAAFLGVPAVFAGTACWLRARGRM